MQASCANKKIKCAMIGRVGQNLYICMPNQAKPNNVKYFIEWDLTTF